MADTTAGDGNQQGNNQNAGGGVPRINVLNTAVIKTLEQREREIAEDMTLTTQQRTRLLRMIRAEYAAQRVIDKKKPDAPILGKRGRAMITTARPSYKKPTNQGLFPPPAFNRDNYYEIYLPDPDNETDPSAIYSNINAIVGSNNMKQVCAYTVGVIICMMPNHKDKILEDLATHGFSCVPIYLPSQALEYNHNMAQIPVYDQATLLTILAFCILFMFKQVNSNNFDQIFASRSAALRNIVGVSPDIPIPKIFTVQKAQAVKTTLGSASELRKIVLEVLINNVHGVHSYSSMARYMCGILEWSEMNSFIFIYETMVLSQSPILQDVRVLHESLCFYELLVAVAKSDHPQYFRYLCPNADVGLLDRSKLLVLTAVAVRIKRELMGAETLQNFVSTKVAESDVVRELYFAHKTFIKASQPNTMLAYCTQMFRAPEVYDDPDQIDIDAEDMALLAN